MHNQVCFLEHTARNAGLRDVQRRCRGGIAVALERQQQSVSHVRIVVYSGIRTPGQIAETTRRRRLLPRLTHQRYLGPSCRPIHRPGSQAGRPFSRRARAPYSGLEGSGSPSRSRSSLLAVARPLEICCLFEGAIKHMAGRFSW